MFLRGDLTYRPIPLPYRADLSNEEIKLAADDFYVKATQRHTVRDFSSRPVDLSVIQTSVKSAGLAPSGANHQPWHFVAVSDVDVKRQIRNAAEEEERKFFLLQFVIIVILFSIPSINFSRAEVLMYGT